MIRPLLLAVLATGCAQAGPRRLVLSTTAAAEGYPCVLHDPRDWPESFMVRQSVDISARKDGRTIEGQLDAVVQKQGDTLLVLGLGPMSSRSFTLTQRGGRIELEQLHGPELPLSPRNILCDVHRVFLKALPSPEGAGFSGVQRGELDGEIVEERWEHGELRARSFTRPGTALRGAVRVEYGPGCRAGRCRPESVTLANPWLGYRLAITNHDYQALE